MPVNPLQVVSAVFGSESRAPSRPSARVPLEVVVSELREGVRQEPARDLRVADAEAFRPPTQLVVEVSWEAQPENRVECWSGG